MFYSQSFVHGKTKNICFLIYFMDLPNKSLKSTFFLGKALQCPSAINLPVIIYSNYHKKMLGRSVQWTFLWSFIVDTTKMLVWSVQWTFLWSFIVDTTKKMLSRLVQWTFLWSFKVDTTKKYWADRCNAHSCDYLK